MKHIPDFFLITEVMKIPPYILVFPPIKCMKPESDQASISNYQFTKNTGAEKCLK